MDTESENGHQPRSNMDPFDFGPIIHTYSRAQALEDGVLVDADDLAREAGFTIPVALTQAAWHDTVAWDTINGALQDETGRLWDVLTMTRYAIIRTPRAATAVVELYRVPNVPHADEATPTTLMAHISPGDNGEPVLTITTPHED